MGDVNYISRAGEGDELPVKCALCGKTVTSKKYDPRYAQIIGGQAYTFDNTDCALMFKKFRSVYGPSLFDTC